MKQITPFVIALFVISGCSMFGGVQGSGKPAREDRKLSGFSHISSKGSVDVEVQVGQEFAVVVEADDNLIPIIKTDVRDGFLNINTDDSFRSSLPVKVKVSMPSLETINIQGSGDITANNINAGNFAYEVTGSGDGKLSGTASSASFVITGSGNVDATNLAVSAAEVRVTGSGDAKVNAKDSLKAQINGSGDVWYKGSPQVDKTLMGSGDVTQLK